MTRTLRIVLLLTLPLLACRSREPRAYTFVPAENERLVPWRVVVLSDDKVDSQRYFIGMRRSLIVPAAITADRIEFATSPEHTVKLVRQPDGTYLLRDAAFGGDLVFRRAPDWDEKFEKALPAPKTKGQAIETLRKMLKPNEVAEYRASKRDDADLRRRVAAWVDAAFGLSEPESALREDLGGSPQEAAGKLADAFWEDLQKDGGAAP